MTPFRCILAALLISIATTVQAQTTDDSAAFVKRFDQFLESSTAKLSWSAPDTAATLPVPMPNAIDASKTHVSDPLFGLWHYPNLGKVYDPKSGYYLDYEGRQYYQYRTDTKAGKTYKGKTEVQLKRAAKVQK